ncbi:MAG: hypothetical protein ACRDT4_19685 [Micromonosporaceae bacterium]
MRSRLTVLAAALFVVVSGVVGVSPSHGGTADGQVAGSDKPAGAQPERAAVMSRVKNADGTVSETIYTLAAGADPAEVARNLRSHGVPGVAVVTDDASPAALKPPCTYGISRTWPTETVCFARWSYNGYGRPQMYFRDRSNDLWPVGRAVSKWNEVSGIDSWYRDFSTGCPGNGVHCVIIYNAYYGTTGQWYNVVGVTHRALNAAQTYYTGAYIALNESYGGTEAQRWNTACHEIGHVLGLWEEYSTATCMYYARTSQRYPHDNDFTLLERFY